jgi:hypothetical protein
VPSFLRGLKKAESRPSYVQSPDQTATSVKSEVYVGDRVHGMQNWHSRQFFSGAFRYNAGNLIWGTPGTLQSRLSNPML